LEKKEMSFYFNLSLFIEYESVAKRTGLLELDQRDIFPCLLIKYIRGEFYDMMKDTLESNQGIQRDIFNCSYVKNYWIIQNPVKI